MLRNARVKDLRLVLAEQVVEKVRVFHRVNNSFENK